MNATDAAAELSVTPRRVRAMIADGRIRAHRSGSIRVIDELAPGKLRRSLSNRSWAQPARALKSRTLVGSERVIRGATRAELAELAELAEVAGVPVTIVADIERSRPLTSPGQVQRVLRALDVEPTALPDMVLV